MWQPQLSCKRTHSILTEHILNKRDMSGRMGCGPNVAAPNNSILIVYHATKNTICTRYNAILYDTIYNAI